ncbi:MAG: phosphatase PAP2 family protein [Candidatus Dormibacteria bacterium]
MSWNSRWYLDLNQISRHTDWAHGMAAVYAGVVGILVLAALLVLGWLLARGQSPRQVAAALSAGVATVVVFILNQPLKHLIAEPRPYETLHHVLVLVGRETSYSMPSDHAVIAGSAIAGILLYNRRLGLLAALAGLALAFDRVYVGAHYPADVMVGLVLGAVVALVICRLLTPPLDATLRVIAKTPLRGLVLSASARLSASPPKVNPPE